MRHAWSFARSTFEEIRRDDVLGVSAELAYRFLFALFPLLIFMFTLGGFVARWTGVENPARQIMDEVGTALPSDARSILETQLSGILDGSNPGLLSFSALAAIWAASSGMKSLMKAMNRAYGVEEGRSFLRKQAVGLGLTLLGSLAFLATTVLIIAGEVAGGAIAGWVGLEGVWGTVVSLARIPVALVILTLAMAFVYWAAPNASLPFQWITPGAVVFTVSWLLSTMAFAFYVANFGSYASTYGAIGGVIVLMTWLYITSFTILLGAEVNAVLHARTATSPDASDPVERDEESSSPQRIPLSDANMPHRDDGSRWRGTHTGAAGRPAAAIGLAVTAVVLAGIARAELSNG